MSLYDKTGKFESYDGFSNVRKGLLERKRALDPPVANHFMGTSETVNTGQYRVEWMLQSG